ncbi:Subtilisin-like serine protease [ANME-1 cluster archaeon GoMg2]|nr:Subtilisin-like serine protease [ANME-1 cluster archaeon GoMg2]
MGNTRNRIVASVGILVVLAMLAVLAAEADTSVNAEDTSTGILLKSRQFVPDAGLDHVAKSKLEVLGGAGAEKTHVLMQFYQIPNASEKTALNETHDVDLLTYVPNNAWFADIPCDAASDIIAQPNVRWIGNILPDDKVSPHIRDYGVGSWAVNPDGTVNLLVTFFGDVSADEAKQVIVKYGSAVAEPSPWGGNVWTVSVPEDSYTILSLASEDAVEWIESVPPPKTINNDGSREALKVNTVQAAPYNLNGSGVVIAEWDEGWADGSHNDLAGRVTIGDTGSAVANHATHVAGTVIGNGTNSGGLLRGMAPEANIVTYEWPDNITEMKNEIFDAINNSAVISTNSWGWEINASNCYLYGDYGTWSQNYDKIVDGKLDNNTITIVFSAGNQEVSANCSSGNYPWPHPWGRLPGPGSTAKNTIVVGATYSDTNNHTCFSSRGPTDDGRIKPDVSAPGDEIGGDGGINSTISGQSYAVKRGTSMSAPAVSGCVALMYQDYRSTHSGANLTPATVKALLIHTAEDLGSPGPNYTYGWGLVNVTAAVDVIRSDNNPVQTILGGVLNNSEVDTYNVYVPAGVELKTTLVWTDEKGAVQAAEELVNNLDLNITKSGSTYYPWLLDPDTPGNPAITGVDSINNVEQVLIDASTSDTYTINVNGTSIPEGPQAYSLIITTGIIYVPDNYATIQWAVDNATEGAAIIVRDNTYNENVNVNKRVTIESENGTENCIVKAADSGDHVFNVSADYVNISGFTVKDANGTSKVGIYLCSIDHCNIAGNNVTNNWHGIYLGAGCEHNNVTRNTARHNGNGIYLYNASNNNISCNRVAYNSKGGFNLTAGSRNNTIKNNSIMMNGNENSSGCYEWNFYNHQSDYVNATNNWWGTKNETKINASIYDHYDNSEKGIVNFTGYLNGPAQCAPVPELSTIILFSLGLLALYICVGRRRKS